MRPDGTPPTNTLGSRLTRKQAHAISWLYSTAVLAASRDCGGCPRQCCCQDGLKAPAQLLQRLRQPDLLPQRVTQLRQPRVNLPGQEEVGLQQPAAAGQSKVVRRMDCAYSGCSTYQCGAQMSTRVTPRGSQATTASLYPA